MITLKDKNKSRDKRRARVRGRVNGTPLAPRLSVYRSSQHIYAQIIDDIAGVTLVSSSTIAKGIKLEGNKTQEADIVGQDLAKKAIAKGITKVVFDRGGYLYHGRIKSLADGARKGGLIF
ncbi:MAG: 50S ribosomal protein L18 [Firmicutes bacterium]|nr:50S ribosomal protein L18 [Bacillota bacterium]MCL1954190.1 50S ribosomal protein L18 [Bacillota bacterium]